MTDLLRRARRRLGRRWRRIAPPAPKRGDLEALLASGEAPADRLRQLARAARAAGDTELADDALLALLHRGGATIPEQRLLRRIAAGQPVPPTPTPSEPVTTLEPVATSAPATTSEPAATSAPGERLRIWREPAGGHPFASVHGADGSSKTVPVWRDAWATLPPSLAEQLAACVLTRTAKQSGVAVVEHADPSTESLAAAAARGAGAERRTEMTQEPVR